jgi:hypothetical protein
MAQTQVKRGVVMNNVIMVFWVAGWSSRKVLQVYMYKGAYDYKQ